MPPRIIIGASLVNVGPELKFIEKGAPLPKSGQIGVGCQIAWRGESRDLLTLFPAVEYSHKFTGGNFNVWKLGCEVWAVESISVRVGHISSEEPGDDQLTYGLGLTTAGLRNTSQNGSAENGNGVLDFILNNVDLQLSFAHQSSIVDEWDGANYYGIELLF